MPVLPLAQANAKPPFSVRHEWAWLLFCVGIGLWGRFWFGGIDYLGAFAHVDLAKYRQMAAAAPYLDLSTPAPFGYRILPSWLAGSFFSNPDFGFYALTTFSLLSLNALFYRFLRLQGASPSSSAGVVAAFTFNPYLWGFTAFNYFQLCDALTFVFALLMVEAIEKKAKCIFACLLCLGALTREPNLLLLPFALFTVWGTERTETRLKAILLWLSAALPALALWAWIRVLATPEGNTWSFSQAILDNAGKWTSGEAWYRQLVNVYVPFGLLPFLFWREALHFFQTHKAWALYTFLVFLSCFLGVDKERLMGPTFWVFYTALALLADTYKSKINKYLLSFIIALIFLVSLHHLYFSQAFLSREVYRLLSIFCLIAVTLLAYYISRKKS